MHRPSSTGWRGLMLELFQCVRSRTAAIVGLVVPISFEICASLSSGIALQQKSDRIGLVLALGDGGVARSLVAKQLRRQRLRGEFEARLRIGLATRDLLRGGLAVCHRIETLHLVGHFAVGDGLISSGCSPQKSAICSKVREVFSTSHTAVALGINGTAMTISTLGPPPAPARRHA